MPPVTDPKDTRVLIPRVRRALEGPAAASGAVGALTDDQVNAVIADAIASIIFYTGGLFGHELVVEERDATYLAPIAWSVDPAMEEAEQTVIAAQAALDYFFDFARGAKVSERIADEGQEWEYSFSATLLNEQLKALREARDQAIERLSEANPAMDTWVNFIEVRDAQTAAIVEPWAQHGMGGQQVDPRFG